MNADLATLSDTDGTAGTDTITVNATDSFGNGATQRRRSSHGDGAPAIAAPAAETIGVGQAAAIPGGGLTESGNTGERDLHGDLADSNGVLSVTGADALPATARTS